MSGIAEVLINMGYTVTGSDQRISAVTKRLESLGGKVFLGHKEAHVAEADVVVKSTAVPITNPEIQAAELANIPVIPRAEMLAELMRMNIAFCRHKEADSSEVQPCMGANRGQRPV